MHNACMATLQIRNFPDAARDTLAGEAAERGQPMAAYIREVLLREASFANNRKLIQRIAEFRSQESRFTTEDILAAIDAGREGR